MSLVSRYVAVALCVVLWGCRSTTSDDPALGAAAAPPPASLVGTTWLVEDIDGGGVLDRVQSTITFQSGARIVGSTACNQYFAAIQLSDTTLGVGVVGSTRRACSPAVMNQETRFVASLGAVRTYRLDGPVLLLLDETGSPRLRLIRVGGSAAPGHAFDCADGPSFVLTPVGDDADLALAGRVRHLTRRRTGSGVRYSDDEVAVWNRGRAALLELEGRTYRCAESGTGSP